MSVNDLMLDGYTLKLERILFRLTSGEKTGHKIVTRWMFGGWKFSRRIGPKLDWSNQGKMSFVILTSPTIVAMQTIMSKGYRVLLPRCCTFHFVTQDGDYISQLPLNAPYCPSDRRKYFLGKEPFCWRQQIINRIKSPPDIHSSGGMCYNQPCRDTLRHRYGKLCPRDGVMLMDNNQLILILALIAFILECIKKDK